MPINLLKPRNPIISYHKAMIAIHGYDSSLALGWREPADQLIRFKILSQIADLNNCTVLDAGCGYADLYLYLKNIYPQLHRYYGVEQMPELFNRAKKRYSHLPDITLLKGNFLHDAIPQCDYILASGSLNYGQAIEQAINCLFNNCTKGLGFNLLKKITGQGILKAHTPDEILSVAKKLNAKAIICEDYSDEDFTVFLYR